jgi:hypothetical protein
MKVGGQARCKSGAKAKWHGPTDYHLEKVETRRADRRWLRRMVRRVLEKLIK